MSATRYEETTPAPRWMRAAGVGALVIAAVLLVLAIVTGQASEGSVAGLAIGLAVCALVGLLLISIRMHLRVTDDTLVLGLEPIVHRRLPLSAIASVSVERVRPAQVGGVGYRIAGADRAFLFSAGPAVAVSLKGSSRRYIWRSDHADEVLAWISPDRSTTRQSPS